MSDEQFIEIKNTKGKVIYKETVKTENIQHLKDIIVGLCHTVMDENIPVKFDFSYGLGFIVAVVENYDGYIVLLAQASDK